MPPRATMVKARAVKGCGYSYCSQAGPPAAGGLTVTELLRLPSMSAEPSIGPSAVEILGSTGGAAAGWRTARTTLSPYQVGSGVPRPPPVARLPKGPLLEGGCGSWSWKWRGPSTAVSLQTTFFMACSGFTHGPPDSLHPAELKIDISRPRRSASEAANLTA